MLQLVINTSNKFLISCEETIIVLKYIIKVLKNVIAIHHHIQMNTVNKNNYSEHNS